MAVSDAVLDKLIKDYQTAIGAVCDIGEAYYRLGKLDAALSALQSGTLLMETAPEQQTLNNSRVALLLKQGKLLVTKGFFANSSYDDAVSVLLRAQELAISSGNEGGIADALQLMGQAYYNKALWSDRKGYERPLEYFQQALARREALGDTRGVAQSSFSRSAACTSSSRSLLRHARTLSRHAQAHKRSLSRRA